MKKYAFYLIIIYVFLRLFNINSLEDLNKTLNRAWDERDNFIELVVDAFSEEEDYSEIYNEKLKYISSSENIKSDIKEERAMFLTLRVSKDEELFLFSDVNFSFKVDSKSLKENDLNMFRRIEDTNSEDIKELKLIGGEKIYSLENLLELIEEENYKENLYIYLAVKDDKKFDEVIEQIKDVDALLLADNEEAYKVLEYKNKGLYIKSGLELKDEVENAIIREEYLERVHENIDNIFVIKTTLNDKFKVNDINSLDKKYNVEGFVVSNIEDILK